MTTTGRTLNLDKESGINSVFKTTTWKMKIQSFITQGQIKMKQMSA